MISKERLKAYFKVFSDSKIRLYEHDKGCIVYNDIVNEFVDDCYKFDMMDHNYLENLKEYLDKDIDLAVVIKSADISLVKSILTFYIRGERFSDGMISKAIDKKIFVEALQRLLEIG